MGSRAMALRILSGEEALTMHPISGTESAGTLYMQLQLIITPIGRLSNFAF